MQATFRTLEISVETSVELEKKKLTKGGFLADFRFDKAENGTFKDVYLSI